MTESREAIARIIDPLLYREEVYDGLATRKKVALEKADAILALLNTSAGEDMVERLRNAFDRSGGNAVGGGKINRFEIQFPTMDDAREFRNALEELLAASLLRTVPEAAEGFQARVRLWMLACFNAEIAADRLERGDRFIEEALELVQSGGYAKDRAHALVEYVYGRSQGDINQEVGGVMVTLAAYCLAFGVDMQAEAEWELARINQPEIIKKIRAKQAAKPKGSALPIAAPPTSANAALEEDQFQKDADTISAEVSHIPEVRGLPDLCSEDVWPHVERALVAVGLHYRALSTNKQGEK